MHLRLHRRPTWRRWRRRLVRSGILIRCAFRAAQMHGVREPVSVVRCRALALRGMDELGVHELGYEKCSIKHVYKTACDCACACEHVCMETALRPSDGVDDGSDRLASCKCVCARACARRALGNSSTSHSFAWLVSFVSVLVGECALARLVLMRAERVPLFT